MLGCCAGVTGIALACAGASVTLTDSSQAVLALTRTNVATNCHGSCFERVQVGQLGAKQQSSAHRTTRYQTLVWAMQVREFAWGGDVAGLDSPDLIIGADIVRPGQLEV